MGNKIKNNTRGYRGIYLNGVYDEILGVDFVLREDRV
jgi:hypothetical protein